MTTYGENLAVALATAIAVLDVFFILVAVPESLPEKARPPAPISWEQADPFAALGKVNISITYVFQVFLNKLEKYEEVGLQHVEIKCIIIFSKVERSDLCDVCKRHERDVCDLFYRLEKIILF